MALTGIGLLSLRVLEALDVHENKIQTQLDEIAGAVRLRRVVVARRECL